MECQSPDITAVLCVVGMECQSPDITAVLCVVGMECQSPDITAVLCVVGMECQSPDITAVLCVVGMECQSTDITAVLCVCRYGMSITRHHCSTTQTCESSRGSTPSSHSSTAVTPFCWCRGFTLGLTALQERLPSLTWLVSRNNVCVCSFFITVTGKLFEILYYLKRN